jgi:hypothetical protein
MTGSGSPRMSRISVIRLTEAANLPASRAPARPPSASATARSTPASPIVRRTCEMDSPGTCSANDFLTPPWLPQKNQRTRR